MDADELDALGAGVPLDVQLGVDLIDILLHAALGQEQLLGDFTVAQALDGQGGHLTLPLGERGEGGGAGVLLRQAAAPGQPLGS